MHRIGALPGCN